MDSLIEIIWNKESQLAVVVGWLFVVCDSFSFKRWQYA